MKARWSQRHPRWVWLGAVVALLMVDQLTKWVISNTLELGETVRVTDWLNVVYVLNTGAAFSVLADAGGWQRWFLIGVSLLVVGAVSIVCLSRYAQPLDRWMGAFVVGGGSGNLMDRVQSGAVVDFLDFHWRNIHWPAFNLADVFIVCAALAWCLFSLKAPPRQHAIERPEELRS